MGKFYMTKKEAMGYGFTHEGTMYGIPVYVGNITDYSPMISVKCILMEYVLDFAEVVFNAMRFEATEIKIEKELTP